MMTRNQVIDNNNKSLTILTFAQTVITSTMTDIGLSIAPAVTSTITTSSGTATIKAPPVITTTTNTITRQDVTLTKHIITRATTYISCIPASPSQAAHHIRRQDKSYRLRNILHKRFGNGTIANTTASAATYITGNCAPLSTTTLTTNTVFASTTLTGATVTTTKFATASSLSTYTPTNTVYAVEVETVTVTPTLTRRTLRIVRRKTAHVMETRTKTKSVYPQNPPQCAQPTVK